MYMYVVCVHSLVCTNSYINTISARIIECTTPIATLFLISKTWNWDQNLFSNGSSWPHHQLWLCGDKYFSVTCHWSNSGCAVTSIFQSPATEVTYRIIRANLKQSVALITTFYSVYSTTVDALLHLLGKDSRPWTVYWLYSTVIDSLLQGIWTK